MPDPITTLFTSVNVSAINSNIITLALAGIAISVIFVGWHFVNKGLARMR